MSSKGHQAEPVFAANFIIIGAMKAGTTTLFNALAEHPGVQPALEKEPGFFSDDALYRRGLGWYNRHFFPLPWLRPIRMEATPGYLSHSEKVAERIRQADPHGEIKFAAVFRDPVQRVYSHYLHAVRHGREQLSFADSLNEEPARLKSPERFRRGYCYVSSYASRLRPFLERFDRSRFSFILTEDLGPGSFADSMRKLLMFLGLPAQPVPEFRRSNRAFEPALRIPSRFIYSLARRSRAIGLFRKLPFRKLRAAASVSILRPYTPPPLDPEIADVLRRQLAPEVRQLQDLIDRDLSAWLPK